MFKQKNFSLRTGESFFFFLCSFRISCFLNMCKGYFVFQLTYLIFFFFQAFQFVCLISEETDQRPLSEYSFFDIFWIIKIFESYTEVALWLLI